MNAFLKKLCVYMHVFSNGNSDVITNHRLTETDRSIHRRVKFMLYVKRSAM